LNQITLGTNAHHFYSFLDKLFLDKSINMKKKLSAGRKFFLFVCFVLAVVFLYKVALGLYLSNSGYTTAVQVKEVTSLGDNIYTIEIQFRTKEGKLMSKKLQTPGVGAEKGSSIMILHDKEHIGDSTKWVIADQWSAWIFWLLGFLILCSMMYIFRK
jgi:hypothetical protein